MCETASVENTVNNKINKKLQEVRASLEEIVRRENERIESERKKARRKLIDQSVKIIAKEALPVLDQAIAMLAQAKGEK